jgi:bidirectional [NiFe] hydrogenase diaphorase subunit
MVTSAPPAGDKRMKLLAATMKKHQYRGDALIEVLHTAQELFGSLSPELLRHVARALALPPSRVYGVATFYHFFSLTPRGEHSCVVCLGTACYVKGAGTILAEMEKTFHVKAGETTPDGKVSLLTARCLGACGIAPAVVFDNETAGHLTAETTRERVKGWAADGTR